MWVLREAVEICNFQGKEIKVCGVAGLEPKHSLDQIPPLRRCYTFGQQIPQVWPEPKHYYCWQVCHRAL